MRRLLVTGRYGFVGTTLARMVETDAALAEWSLAEVPASLRITEPDEVEALIATAAPDAVIHLAARSLVPESFRDPASTIHVNLLGTLYLLQALKRHSFGGRMLFVGTGDVYGSVPESELPISEDTLPAPRNPYAVSKLAAEALCRQWAYTEGFEIVLARPFNHIGPGQSPTFAISDFAQQIAEIRLGRRAPVLAVGDIDVARDFTDVRDVVKSYFALLELGASAETYNVCSGIERTVRSLIERMATIAGLDVAIEQDPARLRKAEQRRVRGDATKIFETTGWRASTPIDESLKAILESWEGKLVNG